MAFNVLEPATQVKGRCVLEASAGTGKTFAIEHIVARLLLEEDILLSEILLVTFTRASTRELKIRIRDNLEKLLNALLKKSVIHPYLTLQKDTVKAVRRIQDALHLFDESQIFTIHGFCHQKLTENAFESKESLSLRSPDEKGELQKKERFVKDLIFSLKEDQIQRFEIKYLFSKYRSKKRLLKELIHVATNDESSTESFQEITQSLVHDLPDFGHIDRQKLLDDFQSLSKNYKVLRKSGVIPYEEQIERLLNLLKKPTSQNFLNWLETEGTIFDFLEEKNKRVKQVECSLHYPDFFSSIAKNFTDVMKRFFDETRILKVLAHLIKKPLIEFLETENAFEPDEILKKMHAAVKNKAFSKKVRSKYQAVIIDEFQDTDPLQWEIFYQIFLEQDPIETFYLVGDPKQSIYGFRNADIYTYLKALDQINNTKVLNTNYRSKSSLISSLNALFSVKPDWLFLPKQNKRLPFTAVHSAYDQDDDHSLSVLLIESEHKRTSWPSKNDERDYFFPFIVNEIKRTDTDFSNWAILVRDRKQAMRVKAYLTQHHIPTMSRSRVLLKDMYLFSSFKELFQTILDPQDVSSLHAFLMSPFVGYNSEEIQELEDSLIEGHLEQLFYLQNTLKWEGLSIFFQSFLKSKWKGSQTVLQTLLSQDLFFEMRELMENFLEFSKAKCVSFESVLNFFDAIETEEEEKEAFNIEKGVQILTIHLSKGLEFDYVYPIGIINRVPESITDAQEEDAEKFRQLYVALTRAKKKLYLPVLIDRSTKKIPNGSASSLELFLSHLLSEEPMHDGIRSLSKDSVIQLFEKLRENEKIELYIPEEKIEVEKGVKAFETGEISIPQLKNLSRSSSKLHSFTGLNLIKPYEMEITEHIDSLPVGVDTGILIHKILEKALKGQLELDKVRQMFKQEMAHSFLKEHENRIFEMIKSALFHPLLPGFTLADLPQKDRQPEVEFHFRMNEGNKQEFKGYIDLFCRYDHRYYIIDWKTNELGGDYSEKRLRDVVNSENYHYQAAIYAYGMKHYLEALTQQSFDECFGGVYFVFLRGLQKHQGVINVEPDFKLLECVS